jgi:hypothetical protein
MDAGLAGAFAAARLMQGIIFGVPAYDPMRKGTIYFAI